MTLDYIVKHMYENPLFISDKQFSAVYAFYDVSDKLVYIGKAKNLAKRIESHFSSHSYPSSIKGYQYEQVNRIMYVRCNNDADALILETCLIAKHSELEYNRQKFDGVPTLLDVDSLLDNLVWEEYINLGKPFVEDLWLMDRDDRVRYIEHMYDEFVRKNNDVVSFLNIFRCFGREFYNSHVREEYCYIVSHMNIPDFDYKLVDDIIGVLKRKIKFQGSRKYSDFTRYGDIHRAFVENYNMPYDVIALFKDKDYVALLPEYVWGKPSECTHITEAEIN